MKVYRITGCNYINDLSGEGAFLNGGRWNSEGVRVLYTALTASLAMLETLAHLKIMPQKGFCIASIHIPDEYIGVYNVELLPPNWNSYPASNDLQKIGNLFVKQGKYLALQLPSAILQEDKVILLNPNHPHFKHVKIEYSRTLEIDNRLYKQPN